MWRNLRTVPGKSIENISNSLGYDGRQSIFHSFILQPTDPPLKPTARAPLPDLVCVMEVTPYLDTLKTSFESFLKRPATIYNQQRCLVG